MGSVTVYLDQKLNFRDAFELYAEIIQPQTENEGTSLLLFAFEFSELTLSEQHLWLQRMDVKFGTDDHLPVPTGKKRYYIHVEEWSLSPDLRHNLASELQ